MIDGQRIDTCTLLRGYFSYYEVMDNNVLKFIFLYSNDSGQGLGAYDSYCLLICFPMELMNTIFSSNMQPAMYFKLCSILVQLWLELSQFGAS